ncbi:MAG: hypothetical protein ACE37L_07580 [Allomuricauda sp.]
MKTKILLALLLVACGKNSVAPPIILFKIKIIILLLNSSVLRGAYNNIQEKLLNPE